MEYNISSIHISNWYSFFGLMIRMYGFLCPPPSLSLYPSLEFFGLYILHILHELFEKYLCVVFFDT